MAQARPSRRTVDAVTSSSPHAGRSANTSLNTRHISDVRSPYPEKKLQPELQSNPNRCRKCRAKICPPKVDPSMTYSEPNAPARLFIRGTLAQAAYLSEVSNR
jgi:hypothetical protein